MTPAPSINERIAVACGWTITESGFPNLPIQVNRPDGGFFYVTDEETARFNLPAYDQSLDACAEAERALLVTSHLKWKFFVRLQQLCDHQMHELIFATPAQRCAALLAVVGGHGKDGQTSKTEVIK